VIFIEEYFTGQSSLDFFKDFSLHKLELLGRKIGHEGLPRGGFFTGVTLSVFLFFKTHQATAKAEFEVLELGVSVGGIDKNIDNSFDLSIFEVLTL